MHGRLARLLRRSSRAVDRPASIVPRRSTAFLCSAPAPFCPGFTLSDPAASACLNSTEAKTVVPLHCSQRSLHRAGGAVAASGRVAPLPCTVHAPDPTSRPSSPVAAPPPPLRLSSAGPSQAPSTSIIPFPSAGQDAPTACTPSIGLLLAPKPRAGRQEWHDCSSPDSGRPQLVHYPSAGGRSVGAGH